MPLNERKSLRSEDGVTIVELLVGMSMGMIVLIALSMMIVTTLHGNARVDARVEATDNARLTMVQIMEELHSACVLPTMHPVLAGSTKETLIFEHAPFASGKEVGPSALPWKSRIVYKSNTLTQEDAEATAGTTQDNWEFGSYGSPRTLVTNVAPAGTEPIFSYYTYETGGEHPGEIGSRLTATTLSEEEAEKVILVKVTFRASPRAQPIADAGAATTISNSATLRLTPPTYKETAAAPPCQ